MLLWLMAGDVGEQMGEQIDEKVKFTPFFIRTFENLYGCGAEKGPGEWTVRVGTCRCNAPAALTHPELP